MTSGDGLAYLRATMAILRGEDGCEWDRQQDHTTLAPYLVEETAELVDAIDRQVRSDIVEELGDVLYQVFFHADILASDPDEPVTVDDIARLTAEKMRRRHPHVFAGVSVSGVDEIRANWLVQKRSEKGNKRSVSDQVPRSLNSVARAQALLSRASRNSIETPSCPDCESDTTGVGSALLALVREAETRGVDADSALRAAIIHLEGHIASAENKTTDNSDNA